MLVLGAKGFAKEVLEILHQNNEIQNLCFYDDVSDDVPKLLYNKFPVLTSFKEAEKYFKVKDNRFTIGIGGVKLRKMLYDKFTDLGGEFITVISRSAEIGSYGVVVEGCIILAGVKISNDVKIGKGTMVYYNSIITHDVIIEDFVEISPNVTILGRSKIGKYTHIGASATILPDIQIGENVIVAAGAVVTKDISSNVMVAGVPATIKKRLRE